LAHFAVFDITGSKDPFAALCINDRNADLVIRSGSEGLPASSLAARKLAPLRQVLCASPEYIEHFGLPGTPAELTEHNCVLFSISSDGNEWTLVGNDEPEMVTAATRGKHRNYRGRVLVFPLAAYHLGC
jgi:DNA-binding transcriptional LysR family regulator